MVDIVLNERVKFVLDDVIQIVMVMDIWTMLSVVLVAVPITLETTGNVICLVILSMDVVR